MELIKGQDELNSFALEIAHGKLGTTICAHQIHQHDLAWNRRRLWLRVLEQVVAEAEGDVNAMPDLKIVGERENATRQAQQYLRALSPDLLAVGAQLALNEEQVAQLTQMRPETLLSNLRGWLSADERSANGGGKKGK